MPGGEKKWTIRRKILALVTPFCFVFDLVNLLASPLFGRHQADDVAARFLHLDV